MFHCFFSSLARSKSLFIFFSFIFILCSAREQNPIIIIYSFSSFSHQRLPMVSHWSLSGSKSPQISGTLHSILADLNSAVVWSVSARPLICKSPSPFTEPLGTVSRVPIIIGITVTFLFHSFFSVLKQDLDINPSFRLLSVLPHDLFTPIITVDFNKSPSDRKSLISLEFYEVF